MSADRASPSWSLCTPWPARGAIAAIQLRGEPSSIDELTSSLGAGTVSPGQIGVRMLAEIDRCVLARFDDHSLFIFPHAGRRILELIGDALESRGAMHETQHNPRDAYPEAADELEARMLAALACAASPLAIDLLLGQPRRWRDAAALGEVDPPTARKLSRLIRPPLVAAIGLPNVGKSSLLNALAGRQLSIVADHPGTTRDHVGATLDLGGLVVRWMDCPGFHPAESDSLQLKSQRAALQMAAAADLLVVCGDAASGFLPPHTLPAGPHRVWVALRTDLGMPLGWPPEQSCAAVSVRTGTGSEAVVKLIRDTLLPPESLKDPRAWRFWDLEPADSESM
jgi:hypothetical protein